MHESFARAERDASGSDRSFALVFAGVFADRAAARYWIPRLPPGPPPESISNQF